MKTILLLITFILISASSVEAQDTLPFSGKTYYNWYFGSGGVSFVAPNKEPIFLTGTIEGGGQNTTTLSDRNGNFLFQSHGQNLENFKHKIINSDMGGNYSQSEGSVLAPLKDGKFIFFTCIFANNVIESGFNPPRYLFDSTGLVYSIFSYDYDADTIIFHKYKVQLDRDYHSEAIQLTYSAVTNNYILVGADSKGIISAYEFDLEGNQLRSKKQPFYELNFNTNGREIRINQMADKITVNSPQGVFKTYSDSISRKRYSHLYVVDFDAATLIFSNYKDIELKGFGIYSMEFSPNSNFLYTYGLDSLILKSGTETLIRYDLRFDKIDQIYTSNYPISKDYYYGKILDTAAAVPADLKIAPNNKIYISRVFGNHLSSIENPNSKSNPNYQLDPVYLGLNQGNQTFCAEGLPSLLSASFAPVYVRSEMILCEGEKLELFAKTQLPQPDAKYSWEGPSKYKTDEQNPIIENIRLDQAGLYIVTVRSGQETYTAETFVRVKPTPKPTLEAYPKAFLCNDGVIVLRLKEQFASYLWSTGDTTEFISVTKSGMYGVTVTNEVGCEAYVELNVGFGSDYVLAIEGDTLKCTGESVTLTSTDEYPEYKWSNGEKTRSITVTNPARYTLTVKTEEGCTVTRTIEVKDHPKVNADLKPTPNTICKGDSTLLESKYDVPYYSYEWNTGAKTKSIYVNITGTYKLTITDTRTGCIDSTEIAIKVEDNLKPTITGSNICSGESATLEALPNDPSYTYKWSNGEETPVIVVSQAGTYNVTVSKAGCVGTAEYKVSESPTPVFEILGENIICNNEMAVLTSSKDFAEYLWSTNEITKEIEVNQAGTYTLTVTDSNGCSATETHKVDKYELKFDISNGSIDFGKVYITENPVDSARIVNTSGFDVVMDLGGKIRLKDGQTYLFVKTLKPEKLGAYSDSYSIHIIDPCDTVITIPITARVYARTTISTEDIYTQIGQTETIPVYLECEADLPIQEYTITTDINRSAFFTNDSYTINQNQIINKAKTNIHNLTGTILLSDDLEYDITFPSYNFTNPYIEVIEKPGKIYIDSVCVFPLRNIQLIAPTTLDISPNPASEQLNIDITIGVQGTMKLELVATDGRVIYSDEWTQSTKSKQMQINTINIPSGLYQVRLITPYDAITKSVIVVE